MTDRKWTPGPWAVTHPNRVKGPEGNTVSDVRFKNGAFDSHLIAAAPDLYEALEDLLEVCDHSAGELDPRECRIAARAALAKARGEQ